MRNHLSDNTSMQMTVVNPPPVQEMNSEESKNSASTTHGEHTGLEIQAL